MIRIFNSLLVLSLFWSTAYAQFPNVQLNGSVAVDHFGTSLGGGIDLNQDGAPDLLVGALSGGNGKGIVKVYTSAGSLLGQAIGTVTGAGFGSSLEGGVDFNGDGKADFVVGARGQRGCGTPGIKGSVRIVSGANLSTIRTITGSSTLFGNSIAVTGDQNGDGIKEIVVGAPVAPACTEEGAMYVYSGGTGILLRSYSGVNQFDRFGEYVAAVGDVDGDGVEDFAGSTVKFSGYTRVYSGATGVLIYQLPYVGVISKLGDVNGDGKADFLLGSSAENNSSGKVRLISGSSGAVVYSVDGENSNDRFGYSISPLGDVDNDSISDFIVGVSSDFSPAGPLPHYVKVLSGIDGSELVKLSGNRIIEDHFGASVFGLPDINGDGQRDLLIGSPSESMYRNLDGVARVFTFPNGSSTPPFANCSFFRLSSGSVVCL